MNESVGTLEQRVQAVRAYAADARRRAERRHADAHEHIEFARAARGAATEARERLTGLRPR